MKIRIGYVLLACLVGVVVCPGLAQESSAARVKLKVVGYNPTNQTWMLKPEHPAKLLVREKGIVKEDGVVKWDEVFKTLHKGKEVECIIGIVELGKVEGTEYFAYKTYYVCEGVEFELVGISLVTIKAWEEKMRKRRVEAGFPQ